MVIQYYRLVNSSSTVGEMGIFGCGNSGEVGVMRGLELLAWVRCRVFVFSCSWFSFYLRWVEYFLGGLWYENELVVMLAWRRV
jgi:hypothetical protein